jgi:NADH-quinone oxidoreductase subunit M
MIAWTIYLTFAGALLVLLLPRYAREIALGATAIATVISGVALIELEPEAVMETVLWVPWIQLLGVEVNFHLAADGISLAMALVTGITGVAAVLFSWDVEKRRGEFFLWLLMVVGGSFGVFLSADLFVFIVFYELVIIPKYFLIATWGSTDKAHGAMKLTLYSFFGGALVLTGIIAAAVTAGSFDLATLSGFGFDESFQSWVFPVMFLGFSVLGAVWPLHTWAPTGHVAAPTAGSMLLAGIVMKLGAYGALRVAMPLFPNGFEQWRAAIAVLAVAGIVIAAGVALRQKDLKFVIGYSSVSHMGFVLLGLATGTVLGLGGAVLQMVSHGIIGALLFAVAGRMIYARTHTRDLDELGGMNLRKALPFAAFTFVIASAASMGIPGFSGFAAEVTVLIGTWQAWPAAVPVTVAGMVLVAVFTLRALKRSFFGDDDNATTAVPSLPPITVPEKVGAIILMLATLVVGIFPSLLLDKILPVIERMNLVIPPTP